MLARITPEAKTQLQALIYLFIYFIDVLTRESMIFDYTTAVGIMWGINGALFGENP